MLEAAPGAARDRTRAHLIDVAADLLAGGGPGAVTTRSVAQAAGVQAPTIYRLFTDKSGLLDAVVAHGFAAYVGDKHLEAHADPVQGLREGWGTHIDFALANPEMFRLMHVGLRSADGRAAVEAGERVLHERVRRVAAAGRLKVSERRAVDLISSAGTGVIFTLIKQPGDERDLGLADAAWSSLAATILVDEHAPVTGPATAAVTLRATLPDLPGFTAAERQLLGEWLTRIADEPG